MITPSPITLRGITWEHARGYDCQVAAAAEFERQALLTAGHRPAVVRRERRSEQPAEPREQRLGIINHDKL